MEPKARPLFEVRQTGVGRVEYRPATEAKAARDEALRRVDEHIPRAWRQKALAAVRLACVELDEWTVDDVWERLDAGRPPEGRAMGAVILQAARWGWCERTDRYRASSQPKCHANPRRVWRSKLR